MIAIIDYEAGNLRSVFNAFEALSYKALLTKDPKDLDKAEAIVLPGVGAFGDGMSALKRANLIDPLSEQILVKKKPYLGICLGMQFLAKQGYEMGVHDGLGWIDGVVRAIRPNESKFRIPHIGWNDLNIIQENPLFVDMDDFPVFYFVHSYQLITNDGSEGIISTTCWHGETITASIQKENIFGVQFHPEKSQENGLKLLENFVQLF